jgi:hypothetical protein
MKHSAITAHRLASQGLTTRPCKSPAEAVATLGAMQAQDYLSALWAIAVRVPDATEADVEKAIASRKIVRTWPMRGTLHFVPAADVRWMLELLTPRILAASKRRWQELELDEQVFRKSRKILVRELSGGKFLPRPAVMEILDRAGIASANQRGIHILSRLAMDGILCFGPRVGKQPSFTLLDEWIPGSRTLDREAALAEIARRYFTGHGPATLQDFIWWTGLKVSDAKAGLANVASRLEHRLVDGEEYWMSPASSPLAHDSSLLLLAPFDEYLVGYRDRTAALDSHRANEIVPGGNGIFLPILVNKGRVVGTWRRTIQRDRVIMTATPFAPFSKSQAKAFAAAAESYGRFVNLPATVEARETNEPSKSNAPPRKTASASSPLPARKTTADSSPQ